MAVFAIIAEEANAKLDKAVEGDFPDNFQLASGQWLIAAKGVTSQQISDKLGIRGGKFGRAIVLSVNDYYGYHRRTAWEWLKTKLAESDDG
jgi:hypothetical protein